MSYRQPVRHGAQVPERRRFCGGRGGTQRTQNLISLKERERLSRPPRNMRQLPRAIFNYFFTVTAPPLPRPDVYSTLCQRSQWGEEITRLRVSTGGSTSHAQQTSGAHKHDGRDEQPVGMNTAAVSNANAQIFILQQSTRLP